MKLFFSLLLSLLYLHTNVIIGSECPTVFDQNRVRYRLVSSNTVKDLNWLFIPGGPGWDSSSGSIALML